MAQHLQSTLLLTLLISPSAEETLTKHLPFLPSVTNPFLTSLSQSNLTPGICHLSFSATSLRHLPPLILRFHQRGTECSPQSSTTFQITFLPSLTINTEEKSEAFLGPQVPTFSHQTLLHIPDNSKKLRIQDPRIPGFQSYLFMKFFNLSIHNVQK